MFYFGSVLYSCKFSLVKVCVILFYFKSRRHLSHTIVVSGIDQIIWFGSVLLGVGDTVGTGMLRSTCSECTYTITCIVYDPFKVSWFS